VAKTVRFILDIVYVPQQLTMNTQDDTHPCCLGALSSLDRHYWRGERLGSAERLGQRFAHFDKQRFFFFSCVLAGTYIRSMYEAYSRNPSKTDLRSLIARFTTVQVCAVAIYMDAS
jgi:hypothetical protein